MAKKKKRRIGNPKELYEACKQWAKDEARTFSDLDNLVTTWNKAVRQDENGRTFRDYVVWNYKLTLKYGED